VSSAIHPIILFDGVCNFCNNTINFLIRQDKKGVFHFAPLQSEIGQSLLRQQGLDQQQFDSFVLVTNSKAYLKSSAALQLIQHLPWYWQWARLLWVVPRPIRDGVYNWIARNRYKWFGKKDACMIPTPEVRSRFL
jgi:predicted DCC family thiol-disulfide oxidoreductase YuxK